MYKKTVILILDFTTLMLNNAVRSFSLDLREYVEKLWDKNIPIINHVVIEAVGFNSEQLSENYINDGIELICKKLDFHIVKKFDHQFEPQGTSIVFILEESHLAIHTWPEKSYIHIDLVTCTKEGLEPVLLVGEFSRIFQSLSMRIIQFKY